MFFTEKAKTETLSTYVEMGLMSDNEVWIE